MPEILPALLTALLAGLAGSGHCLGMCGGIAGAMGASCPALGMQRHALLLSFNLGRVLGYGLLGALFGALAAGGVAVTGTGGLSVLRILAGLLLIAVGVHLAVNWRGLDRLAALGAPLWRRLAPLTRRLLPLQHHHQAWLLGALWGWLPCGLVYAMLATAATQADPGRAAMIMLSFGLGTLPAMFATSVGGQQMLARLRGPQTRRIAGLLLMLFGLWTILGPTLMSLGGGHHH